MTETTARYLLPTVTAIKQATPIPMTEKISAVTDGYNTLISYSYDSDGNLTRQQNANGTYTLYSYVGDRIISIVHHDAAGDVLSSFSYTYDAGGNITAMTDSSGTWNYSYDAHNQLAEAVSPDGKVTSYAYDAAGNRVQVNADVHITSYTANGLKPIHLL